MEDPITIIGAGITGLAIAYTLSQTHPNITILARDHPGDLGTQWASPWAGAVFHPQSTPSKAQQKLQINSFKFYHALSRTTPSAGVKSYPMTEYFDNRSPNTGTSIWYSDLMPDYHLIPKDKLPHGITLGVKYTSLAMNPRILLPWLRDRLVEKGIKFVRMEVGSFQEAREVCESRIVINASGVGARELAGDEGVRPVRGQTMFVKTDFQEVVMRDGGSEYTYVIPRVGDGGVVMGGIKSERLDGEVDVELKSDILMRVNRITGDRFKSVDLESVQDIVGFRPGRKGGLRLEREGHVVHAYGVEGAGYIYSFGIAERVRELIDGPIKTKL